MLPLFRRDLGAALWGLPIFLTLAICGFCGLLIVYLLPEIARIYALGRRDEREAVAEDPRPAPHLSVVRH